MLQKTWQTGKTGQIEVCYDCELVSVAAYLGIGLKRHDCTLSIAGSAAVPEGLPLVVVC